MFESVARDYGARAVGVLGKTALVKLREDALCPPQRCGGRVQRVDLPRGKYPVLVQALEHAHRDGRECPKLGLRLSAHTVPSRSRCLPSETAFALVRPACCSCLSPIGVCDRPSCPVLSGSGSFGNVERVGSLAFVVLAALVVR